VEISDNSLLPYEQSCTSSDLRAKYVIKTPDAIQIATTICGGSKSFITNDESLKKVEEIRVLLLDDLVKTL